jgi:sulfatase modifying factor 1
LDQIDFRRLYVEGVILANTRRADAADTEEPALGPAIQGPLDSLLQLHGPFVTATMDGLGILALEERYRRRPEGERQYRADAVELAEGLQGKPEITDPAVAYSVREAAKQIDLGSNPERSGVVATSMLRNYVIVASVGATVAAFSVVGGLAFGPAGTIAGLAVTFLGGHALSKSKPFESVRHSITHPLDYLSEAELHRELESIARAWRPQLQFVLNAEPALRRLAGDRESFAWLHKSLDWIKQPPAAASSAPATPPETPGPAAAAPVEIIRDLPDGPELLVIPAGRFTMGVPPEESERENASRYDTNARPLHEATIARPFCLGRFPVTLNQFAAFVRAARYRDAGPDWRTTDFKQSGTHPVVNVRHADAQAYAAWLSQRTGKSYRLPSEAEWEYAVRAGTTTARYWGDDRASACRYANIADEALRRKEKDEPNPERYFECDDGFANTSPVGSFLPNGFGLYDMLGNVWEWTADWWNETYEGAPLDGTAWTSGEAGRRVVRGGSWFDYPRNLRASIRVSVNAVSRDYDRGFRVARSY